MTSSAVSRTRSICPVVNVITVSGVTSMCSIKSEFNTSGTRFSRVSRIIEAPLSISALRRRTLAQTTRPAADEICEERMAFNTLQEERRELWSAILAETRPHDPDPCRAAACAYLLHH